jgi:hypothetical protein
MMARLYQHSGDLRSPIANSLAVAVRQDRIDAGSAAPLFVILPCWTNIRIYAGYDLSSLLPRAYI